MVIGYWFAEEGRTGAILGAGQEAEGYWLGKQGNMSNGYQVCPLEQANTQVIGDSLSLWRFGCCD